MRKQSSAQITGREGERWFASVLPPEWSIQRPPDDFGLDGIVAVGTPTHVTSYEFGVQVKSSTGFKLVRDHVVVPRIPYDTILYWSAKFFPTLLVAYDTKKQVGYFEWISNLVGPKELEARKSELYLHIPRTRMISSDCWTVIEAELKEFHWEFSKALQASREILPVASQFATLLRNLCFSNMADQSDSGNKMIYMTVQSWTHIEVVRCLDALLPKITRGSVAAKNLTFFRDAYFRVCDKLFLNFADLCREEPNSDWIMVKKESQPLLNELTAMLSECVDGLLRHVAPMQ